MQEQRSGKLGSLVYSRNRNGAYIRTYVKPVDPRSVKQLERRALVQSLVEGWRGISEIDRAAWEAFALGQTVIGRLGRVLTLTGEQWYIKCGLAQLQASKPVSDTSPSVWSGSVPTAVTAAVDETVAPYVLSLYTLGVDGAPAVAVPAEHALVVQAGPQRLTSQNYVPPSLYRVIQVAAAATAIPLDVSAGYKAVFGDIPGGVTGYYIPVRIKLIRWWSGVGSASPQYESPWLAVKAYLLP